MKKYEIFYDKKAKCKRLNVYGAWSPSYVELMRENKIASLLIRLSVGWDDKGVSFLPDLKWLKGLYIQSITTTDFSVIDELTDLRVLSLETPKAKKGPHFPSLTKLEHLLVDWRPCFSSLHECKDLRYLHIDKYKGKDLSSFREQPFLQELLLINGSLNSLEGSSNFPDLKNLTLYQLTKLTSIGAVRDCRNLKLAVIEACKKVEDLESLLSLSLLEVLVLERTHNIKSIKGISKLNKLKKLRLCDMAVEDGDMSELVGLKKRGVDIFFSNKKHYSPTHKEICPEFYSW